MRVRVMGKEVSLTLLPGGIVSTQALINSCLGNETRGAYEMPSRGKGQGDHNHNTYTQLIRDTFNICI